jgi:hypothetical protein
MKSCISAGSRIVLHTFDASLNQFLLMRQGPLDDSRYKVKGGFSAHLGKSKEISICTFLFVDSKKENLI